jgi:formate hydrogenlyase transcriptional activator
MVTDREFRSDLYYRLKVFPIEVPPLRELSEDIPMLVRYFTQRYAEQMKKPITNIAAETMTTLCRYAWPGNVRELENLMERSVILSPGPSPEVPLGELKSRDNPTSIVNTLEETARGHILRALEECDWMVGGPSGAAVKLGMKRTTLQSRMQKLGISQPKATP